MALLFKKTFIISFLILFVVFMFLTNISVTEAKGVTLLQPIDKFIEPPKGETQVSDLGQYFQNLLRLGYALVTGLAVVSGSVGAVMYIATAAVPQKTEGLDRVKSAAGGVILAATSITILSQIDSNLVRLDFVQTLKELESRLEVEVDADAP